MATPVLNPTTFTIVATPNLTGMNILVGVASGGPYNNTTFKLTAAEIAAGAASGTYTGTLSSVGDTLVPGIYYAVPEAVNAAGTSPAGPEASWTVQAAPSAPTGFSVS
jgi:hypothetical protein